MIVNLGAGGPSSGGFVPEIEVSVRDGAIVTATCGSMVLTEESDSSGKVLFALPSYGTWVVKATRLGYTSNIVSTVVDTVKRYTASLVFFESTLTVTYPVGATCTCTKGSLSYTAPDTTGTWVIPIYEAGTYTVKAVNGERTCQANVVITASGENKASTIAFFAANVKVNFPVGSTLTCTKGSKVLTAPSNATSPYIFEVWEAGDWVVKITKDGKSVQDTASITATGQTVEKTLKFFAASIVVTYPAGATLTCTKGSVTQTAASTTGSYTFTVGETGTYVIKAVKGSDSSEQSVSITQDGQSATVSLAFFDPVFANNSWEKIIQACQEKKVPDTWVAGNTKEMTVGSYTYQIAIMGKNHDDYETGGKAPLTFGFVDCYRGGYKQMNTTNTNSGGYGSSAMHTTHLPAIKNEMPAAVKAAIRRVIKKTSAGAQSSTIVNVICELFLAAEIEIFGTTTYSFAGEGTQYDYYKNGGSKVKKGTDGSSAYGWWERSPCSTSSASFCFVASGGTAYAIGASRSIGVPPCFCF